MTKIVCCRCGGYGGEDASHFGDHGWHPCFHCGTTGYCNCPECQAVGDTNEPQTPLEPPQGTVPEDCPF